MKTTTITLRVSEELLERISKVATNRNAFFVEAVEQKLTTPLTNNEKREVLKGAKNLSDLMQDLILQEAANRKNFLETMDNDSFAKLVAARLPKENQDDGELDADVLSLQKCLDDLPGVEDLTQELTKVKGHLHKAEFERDVNLRLLKHADGKAELAELMSTVYNGAVKYAAELVARKNLPGFGDGGGLTDAAYAMIAKEVEKELKSVEVFGC